MLDPTTRILVVDDVPLMRRLTCSFLSKMGIKEVREAKDGKAALEALRQALADLVISDWNMPEMSGIELLREIRSDAALKGIPLLLMTATDDKGDINEAMKCGISDYIAKPFDSKSLEAKIRTVLTESQYPGKTT